MRQLLQLVAGVSGISDYVDVAAGSASASRSGDVKTPKSKRSLTLPKRALVALKAHKRRQAICGLMEADISWGARSKERT